MRVLNMKPFLFAIAVLLSPLSFAATESLNSTVQLKGTRKACQGVFLTGKQKEGDVLATPASCLNDFNSGGIAIQKGSKWIWSVDAAVHPYLLEKKIADPSLVESEMPLLDMALVSFPPGTADGYTPIAKDFRKSIAGVVTREKTKKPQFFNFNEKKALTEKDFEFITKEEPGTPVYDNNGELVGLSLGCKGKGLCQAISFHDRLTLNVFQSAKKKLGESAENLKLPDTSHELGFLARIRARRKARCAPVVVCRTPVRYCPPPPPPTYCAPRVYVPAPRPVPSRAYISAPRSTQQTQVYSSPRNYNRNINQPRNTNNNNNPVNVRVPVNVQVNPIIENNPTIIGNSYNNKRTETRINAGKKSGDRGLPAVPPPSYSSPTYSASTPSSSSYRSSSSYSGGGSSSVGSSNLAAERRALQQQQSAASAERSRAAASRREAERQAAASRAAQAQANAAARRAEQQAAASRAAEAQARAARQKALREEQELRSFRQQAEAKIATAISAQNSTLKKIDASNQELRQSLQTIQREQQKEKELKQEEQQSRIERDKAIAARQQQELRLQDEKAQIAALKLKQATEKERIAQQLLETQRRELAALAATHLQQEQLAQAALREAEITRQNRSRKLRQQDPLSDAQLAAISGKEQELPEIIQEKAPHQHQGAYARNERLPAKLDNNIEQMVAKKALPSNETNLSGNTQVARVTQNEGPVFVRANGGTRTQIASNIERQRTTTTVARLPELKVIPLAAE